MTMPVRTSVCVGAAFLFGLTSGAPAASLKGDPFVLFKQIDPGANTRSFVVERDNETIELAYDLIDPNSAGRQRDVFRQLLNKFGAPKSDATLVFSAESADDTVPQGFPVGVLPLADGKAFVGYSDVRPETSAVFGRTVDRTGAVGDEVTIDDTSERGAYQATTLALGASLIVITDDLHPKSKTGRITCNFIGQNGALSAQKVDITLNNKSLAQANRYDEGFIASYGVGANDRFVAQIFDAECKALGQPQSVPAKFAGETAKSAYALGLADGSIAVFRAYRQKRGSFLTAQVYRADWSAKTDQAVIAETPLGLCAGVTAATAGGDFVLGTCTANSQGIASGVEIQRFNQKLRRIGAAAKLKGYRSPTIRQILSRQSGDVTVFLTSYSKDDATLKLTGQSVKP